MTVKRVLVTGSRDWPHPEDIENALDNLWNEIGPFVLIHGAARGADQMAELNQAKHYRPTESHPADWDQYGKRAGYVRNAEMVNLGADLCLAFIKDNSKGATMCADLAEKAGIPTRRFTNRAESCSTCGRPLTHAPGWNCKDPGNHTAQIVQSSELGNDWTAKAHVGKLTGHNHVTRDIKPLGKCPGCDEYHEREKP